MCVHVNLCSSVSWLFILFIFLFYFTIFKAIDLYLKYLSSLILILSLRNRVLMKETNYLLWEQKHILAHFHFIAEMRKLSFYFNLIIGFPLLNLKARIIHFSLLNFSYFRLEAWREFDNFIIPKHWYYGFGYQMNVSSELDVLTLNSTYSFLKECSSKLKCMNCISAIWIPE